mmetsp:Transcript_15939/g.23467  ORF Transcript_15939/g.23467 Transcript_15939/m.23467 type:complete len:84 (+) Transcript_15939:756-1007(+)
MTPNKVKKNQPTGDTSESLRQLRLSRGHEKEYFQTVSAPKSNEAALMKNTKHRVCVARTARAGTHAVKLLLKKKLYTESFPMA